MPTTNHTITVTIDGVDRSSLLLADSLYVRSSVGNNTDVCEFALRDSAGSYEPLDWDEVTISINGTDIFGGYIIQRDVDSIGGGSAKRAVWQVQCKDWSILLDTKIVNEQYVESDDSAILADLFSTYLTSEGFDTSTSVSTVRADIDINFEQITLREALNDLAARAGANWHIAPNKDVYWYEPTAPAAAAFNIDTASPDDVTSFNALEGSIKRVIDSTQILNRIRIIGAEAASTVLQTDTFAANGTDSVFGPLTKKPNSLWHVSYVVEDGGSGTTVNAYASQIGIAPGDSLLTDGGTFTIIANLENRTLKITDTNDLVPKSGTNVTVKYYYTTPIEVTRNDTESQNRFGRIFETLIYDENLTTTAEAEAYGDRLLDEYAYGRETVRFDVTEHGLLPGRLISLNAPAMAVYSTYFEPNILLDNNDKLLREDSDELFLESSTEAFNYLIQEVQVRGVVTGNNTFMVVASVSAGKIINTLIESLAQIPGFSAGSGRAPARSTPGRLSNISTDLGEIVAGRAMFTDGGTARFDWGTPNSATGAVIGLEDVSGNPYGAFYIYNGGTVKAKLGRMTDMPDIGTITPTGWGLYTTNGYFSGQVVASTIDGGTITGGLVTGGTVTGGQITGGTISGAQINAGTITGNLFTGGTVNVNAGTIGGWTLQNNHLWSNGGTISTGSVVNSSNPGVYLGTAGLFGFGTIGMTFGLWTDPARAPFLSSGTINNVVYEVYESAIVRTNADVFADGGIQMDNSGIFGVSPIAGAGAMLLENGDDLLLEDGRGIELYGLKFALDSVTGRLYAEEAYIQGDIFARSGSFTGTVSASQISGGTVTGAVFSGGSYTQGTISAGTISGAQISGGTITGSTITANTISGGTVTGARISGGTVTGGFVSGGTVSGGFITGGTVSGGFISGGTVSSGIVSGGTVTGSRISGGTVTGSLVSGGTVTGASISAAGGTVTLNNSGLQFSDGIEDVINPARAQWVRSGTVLSSLGAYYVTPPFNNIVLETRVGVSGSHDGEYRTRVVGSAGTSQMYQFESGWDYYIGGTAQFGIDSSQVVTKRVRPILTNAYDLGESTFAYRYLYLSDGTDEWRIQIDTSGNLVTTKV